MASSPPHSPPSTSPSLRPTVSSRNPSLSASRRGNHVPAHPSGLRRSIVPRESTSPEDHQHNPPGNGNAEGKKPSVPHFEDDGIAPAGDHADTEEDSTEHLAEHQFWTGEPGVRTRLLGHDNWDAASGCGSENCGHGTFSPRPLSPTQGSYGTYGSFSSSISQLGFGGAYPEGDGPSYGDSADPTHGLLGDTVADGILGGGNGNKMSTTNYLAHRHGINSRRRMCDISEI
jgi:hypothetical protein